MGRLSRSRGGASGMRGADGLEEQVGIAHICVFGVVILGLLAEEPEAELRALRPRLARVKKLMMKGAPGPPRKPGHYQGRASSAGVQGEGSGPLPRHLTGWREPGPARGCSGSARSIHRHGSTILCSLISWQLRTLLCG